MRSILGIYGIYDDIARTGLSVSGAGGGTPTADPCFDVETRRSSCCLLYEFLFTFDFYRDTLHSTVYTRALRPLQFIQLTSESMKLATRNLSHNITNLHQEISLICTH